MTSLNQNSLFVKPLIRAHFDRHMNMSTVIPEMAMDPIPGSGTVLTGQSLAPGALVFPGEP
jgi:hypothetical protein